MRSERHQGSESGLSERQDRLGADPGHQKGPGGFPGNLRLAWGRYQAGVGTIIESPTPRCSFPRPISTSSRPSTTTGFTKPELDKAVGRLIKYGFRFRVLSFREIAKSIFRSMQPQGHVVLCHSKEGSVRSRISVR